jgi:hypothetical protein
MSTTAPQEGAMHGMFGAARGILLAAREIIVGIHRVIENPMIGIPVFAVSAVGLVYFRTLGGDCARAFGAVAAALRASGNKPAARAYDALTAASAIARALPLYTCNPADFAGIPRLELRSVTHPYHQ